MFSANEKMTVQTPSVGADGEQLYHPKTRKSRPKPKKNG